MSDSPHDPHRLGTVQLTISFAPLTVPPGQISKNSLNFLNDLHVPENNDREWSVASRIVSSSSRRVAHLTALFLVSTRRLTGSGLTRLAIARRTRSGSTLSTPFSSSCKRSTTRSPTCRPRMSSIESTGTSGSRTTKRRTRGSVIRLLSRLGRRWSHTYVSTVFLRGLSPSRPTEPFCVFLSDGQEGHLRSLPRHESVATVLILSRLTRFPRSKT
jgi:hypothetical protein